MFHSCLILLFNFVCILITTVRIYLEYGFVGKLLCGKVYYGETSQYEVIILPTAARLMGTTV